MLNLVLKHCFSSYLFCLVRMLKPRFLAVSCRLFGDTSPLLPNCSQTASRQARETFASCSAIVRLGFGSSSGVLRVLFGKSCYLFGCCSGVVRQTMLFVRVLFGWHPNNCQYVAEALPKLWRSCPNAIPILSKRIP